MVTDPSSRLAAALLLLAPGAVRAAAVAPPLVFEANRGQTDPRVEFIGRGRGYTVFLTAEECAFRLDAPPPPVGPPDPRSSPAVHLRFVGAAPQRLEGRGPLAGTSSYFVGNDPDCWLSGVPTFERVLREELYPGVRAEFYGNGRNLEYDLILEPGGRRDEIEVEFAGASGLALNEAGDLLVRIPGGELVQRRPRVYQELGGERRAVAARYRLSGGPRAAIELEPVAPGARIVIDPEIEYGSHLGGSGEDYASSVHVDAQGYIYIAGGTASLDFPQVNPLVTPRGGTEALLVKLDPTGRTVLQSTFFGGSGDDGINDLALGPAGEIYLAGSTRSDNFPVLNAFQSTLGGQWDAFVTQLSPAGDSILFSTYLGGSQDDTGRGLAVGPTGTAYVGGMTQGLGFPIVSPVFQSTYGGSVTDGFVAALRSDGTPIYCGFLGGGGNEELFDIVAAPNGEVIVVGDTDSTFPVRNAYQPTLSGTYDGFVTRLTADGRDLVFSTYFGGGNAEFLHTVALDGSGVIHISGYTGIAVPLMNPLPGHDMNRGGYDLFITRFSGDGQQLLYSTLLGGTGNDRAYAIAVDAMGNTYVGGLTESNDFPLVNRLDLQGPSTDEDAFVARISADGRRLDYSTYLSGSGNDVVYDLFVTSAGTAYVLGDTASSDIPAPTPIQPYAGGRDMFLIVIGPLLEGSGAALEPSVEVGAPVGFQIQLENKGLAPVTNLVLEDVFPTPALDTSAFDPLVHVATSAPAFPGWTGGKLTLTFSNPIPPGGKETVLITGLTAATAGVHTNEATLIHQTEENITVAMDFVIGDPGTLPGPVTGLRMAKLATGLRIRWDGTDPLAPRYNLWRQRAGKTLIPVTNAVTARRDKRILATCSAVPQVNPLTTCLQANAIPGAPGVEFYQVRGLNAADLEGD